MSQLANHQAFSNIWDLLPAHAIPGLSSRHLQDVSDLESSPPTDYSLSLTPKGYRSNSVIDAGKNLSSLGLCNEPENTEACQIIFPPSKEFLEHSKIGVIFYGGGLVDTRGYSPIAHQLSNRYGLPVVIPFFENDLAFEFGSCDTKKVELASRAFPQVQKWILAGHSYGVRRFFFTFLICSVPSQLTMVCFLLLLFDYLPKGHRGHE